MENLKMKKLILITLFIAGCAIYAAEWKNSSFWSSDSAVSLPGTARKMIVGQNDLVIAGTHGIKLFKPVDGKYVMAAEKKFKQLYDAVRMDDRIVALSSEGFLIWNIKTGEVHKSTPVKPQYLSYNQPQLAAVPAAGKILVLVYKNVYEFDPVKRSFKNLKISMPLEKSAIAGLPDGTAVICNMQKLYRYDGKLKELPLPADFKQRELYHIGVSADGKFLYFGHPLAAYELSSGKIIRTMPDIKLIRWGYALDPKRNELYAAGWRHVSVLANADDPRKWQEIDRLGSTDSAPLYTHRDAAPASTAGSLCYLPATDELLFSSRVGITILGMTPPSVNGVQNNWDKYRSGNAAIPGDSAIHQALRKRKMIGAWVTTSHAVSEDALDNMKKSGINTIIHMVFQIDHGRFYKPHDVRKTILETGKRCAQKDITYILCITPYNISINNSYPAFRRLVLPDGTVAKYQYKPRNPLYKVTEFPCYLDREYSEKAGIQHNMVEFAKLAKEAKIAGVVFELGDGFTPFRIKRQPCVCDSCFKNFLAYARITAADVAPDARRKFLIKAKKWNDFQKWQSDELVKLITDAHNAMRKISPEMTAAVMLPETSEDYSKVWLFNAFIKGFQRKGNPVPVFSEQTYALPYTPELCNGLDKKWAAQGMETILIPGQVNYWVPPAELQKRVKEYLEYTPGVYYYHNYRWYTERRKESFYAPMDKNFRKGSFTVGDYMDMPAPAK